MKTEDLLEKLTRLKSLHGNVEVSISDGYECRIWCGNWDVQMYKDLDGTDYIDIGIGGTEVDEQ